MKNKIFKNLIILAVILSLALTTIVSFAGCNQEGDNDNPNIQLTTPTNVRVDGLIASWDNSSGSISYTVRIGTREFLSDANEFDLSGLNLAFHVSHDIRVRANAANSAYNSPFSTTVPFIIGLPPHYMLNDSEWYEVRNSTIEGLSFHNQIQENLVSGTIAVGLPTSQELIRILDAARNAGLVDVDTYTFLRVFLMLVDTTQLFPSAGFELQTYNSISKVSSFTDFPNQDREDVTHFYFSLECDSSNGNAKYLFAYAPTEYANYDYGKLNTGLPAVDGIFSSLGVLSYHGFDAVADDLDLPQGIEAIDFIQVTNQFAEFLLASELDGFSQNGSPNTLYLNETRDMNYHVKNILEMAGIIGGGDDDDLFSVVSSIDNVEVSEFTIRHDRQNIRELNIVSGAYIAFGDIANVMFGNIDNVDLTSLDNVLIPITLFLNLEFDFNSGSVQLPANYFLRLSTIV